MRCVEAILGVAATVVGEDRVFVPRWTRSTMAADCAAISARIDELAEAIVLLPARTETQWWWHMTETAPCFAAIKGRLKFPGHRGGANFPSALVYIGVDVHRFREAVSPFSRVFVRGDGMRHTENPGPVVPRLPAKEEKCPQIQRCRIVGVTGDGMTAIDTNDTGRRQR